MTRGKYIRTTEWRKALSLRMLGNKNTLGRKLSDSTKNKISLALRGHTLSEETKTKLSKAHEGVRAYNWKGEKASYVAKHTWIKRKLGSPNKCDLCLTTTAKDYQWANKNHKYRRNLNDWIRLCIVCHRKYDKEHNLVDKQIN